jgi:gamma-glutamylcyclotransferase (GGCT)/AIG2-like uncharacterized protein YtfP
MESSSYLFVYGTLMKKLGHPMPRLLATHARYLCDGSYQGRLFRISWYPGVVPSDDPTDQVHGEIYRILDEHLLFEKLDEYEVSSLANPSHGEYIRTQASILDSNSVCVECQIYLYNRKVNDAQWIKSGAFVSTEI